MAGKEWDVDDDYVVVTNSDAEPGTTSGEKPEVIFKIKQWLSPTEFDVDISEYRKHLTLTFRAQDNGSWLVTSTRDGMKLKRLVTSGLEAFQEAGSQLLLPA